MRANLLGLAANDALLFVGGFVDEGFGVGFG